MTERLRFALNHMSAPNSSVDSFFDLAVALGMDAVEIRNDLAGNAIADGTPAASIREAADVRGLSVASINALQRFNDWNDDRRKEAEALAAYARSCGADALVLVPSNDGAGRASGERQGKLRSALKALRPILENAGITGLVEPLGFESSSLRFKSEAAEAIDALCAWERFRIVHDTFHHFVAREVELFPEQTGLVHVSGVTDRRVGVSDLVDRHRILVDSSDLLDNVGQIRCLLAAGFRGRFSFEPFAPSVHESVDIETELRNSAEWLKSQMAAAGG